MKVVLSYTQEVRTPWKEAFLFAIAKETLVLCAVPQWQEKTISLNAVAVSPEKISELNLTYRGKDAVTDILSFGEYAERTMLAQETAPEIFLGELFFCQEFIAEAAETDHVSLEREMAYIFSHGILHLLGYDHSEKMFALQDTVTDRLAPAPKEK